MRDGWQECALGDAISLIIDHRGKTPKKLGLDWSLSGYRALSARNIKTGKIVQPENVYYASEELYRKWMKEEIIRGDILITSEAPFGETYYWNSDEKIILSQRLYALRCKNTFSSKFLYYFMNTEGFQGEMRGRATGTTVIGLRQPELLKCKIVYPSLCEQHAIAATLSCLDKKIELNNKINANLEAQAQAIFKSWFVDFEPFQDGEFVESELGMIPKGWRVGVLSELINVKYGKDHKKLGDGTIPVYGSGGIMRYAEKALYERESVLIPRKGTLNNVIYINEPFWTVDTMFYSEMRHPHIAKFIYFLVSGKNLASMNSGSAVPSMTTDILNNLLTPIAPDSIFYEYDRLVSPLFNAIHKNTKQSNTLADLRDTLLPKLMSGEIEVPMEESM